MDNQKNLLLAVVFSLVVLIGYDAFFNPKTQVQNQQQIELQNNDVEFQKLDKDLPILNTKKTEVKYYNFNICNYIKMFLDNIFFVFIVFFAFTD